jgi:hypothetical protein
MLIQQGRRTTTANPGAKVVARRRRRRRRRKRRLVGTARGEMNFFERRIASNDSLGQILKDRAQIVFFLFVRHGT